MRYALIQAGQVATVVEQDSTPQIEGQWVACGNAGPGWLWDGATFTAPPTALSTILTKTALLTRLTDAEFVGILTAAKTDVAVEAWKYRFDSATQVDLADSRTVDGLQLLVTKGLLTQARADAILTTPVQDSERP